MWRELAAAAYPAARFAPSAPAAAIDAIGHRLQQPVPADLRSLLLETDGILGEFSTDVVWTADRIAHDNASWCGRRTASPATTRRGVDGGPHRPRQRVVVWTADRIARDNASFRTNPDFAELYPPFDLLLFFGDNGGGDQFALVPADPAVGVVVWEHETGHRRTVARDRADYLRQVLTAEATTGTHTPDSPASPLTRGARRQSPRARPHPTPSRRACRPAPDRIRRRAAERVDPRATASDAEPRAFRPTRDRIRRRAAGVSTRARPHPTPGR